MLFSEPIYGGTEYLLHNVLPDFGIHTVPFRAGIDDDALAAAAEGAAGKGRLAMIYVETPANPTNDLVDIEACAAVARRPGPSSGAWRGRGRRGCSSGAWRRSSSA